ncbi:MAG: polymer-forming cytoskeletal protein [Nitrospira sp.]|nr:polymer-forming cytoskeletal protein [Nitrospira sp.]
MWKPEKQDGTEENGPSLTPARVETREDVSAFIGKGVDFKGAITYSGTVRIDGSLDGEITTDGVLLVGEDAVLKAKVTAGTLICKGKITGDIHIKEKLKLRAPAVINGGGDDPHVVDRRRRRLQRHTRNDPRGSRHATRAGTSGRDPVGATGRQANCQLTSISR